MLSTPSILAGFALTVWIYLTFFRGGFWRAIDRLGTGSIEPLNEYPEIVVVIPARDEADVIGRTIRSLLAQDYPHPFRIVLVDDVSHDATAVVARTAAAETPGRLTVIEGKTKPTDWVGKVWAMDQGALQAAEIVPKARYILFSDADIEHDSSNLRRLVTRAERDGADLVSIMVMLVVGNVWERLLIPPFIFFFQLLYPFAFVNAGRSRAAAGGCMLVRRATLEAAGGLKTIKRALIDDCALARRIAEAGGNIWLGLSTETHSTRPYGGFAGVWKMVARNAFTQLKYSPLALVGTILGMALIYLTPPLAAASYLFLEDHTTALIGAAGFMLMVGIFWPTVRLYNQPFWVAIFLPVAAALYTAMTVDSALHHWRGVGGGWKGRVYSK
jgi:hopene-associated glycosyltransferase HpnB